MRSTGRRLQWRQAFTPALSGLFVAVVVSLLIYSTPLAQFGADASQRLMLGLNLGGGALGAPNQTMKPHSPTNWVFVDLGGRFCGGESGGRLCPPARANTDRNALANLLSKLRARQPRLIILDVATKPVPDEDEALLALLKRSGAPILLAWNPDSDHLQTDPSGNVSLVSERQNFLCDPFACRFPAARYFPSLRRMSGPTARRLAADYAVADTEGAATRRVPSIAHAAAMIAQAPGDAPFALLDAAPETPTVRAARNCPDVDARTCSMMFAETERVFSFKPVDPSVPRTDGESWPPLAFLHYVPDANPITDSLPRDLTDAVIVVGDSRESAGDRTWAVTGEVSGAELILNDSRQFLLAGPHPKPGLFAHLRSEIPFLLVGFAALLIIQACLGHHAQRPRGFRANIVTVSRTAALLLLTMVVTALAFAGLLWMRGIDTGAPTDLVTPFLGIVLESLLDTVHQSIGIVEGAATCLVDAIARGKKGQVS